MVGFLYLVGSIWADHLCLEICPLSQIFQFIVIGIFKIFSNDPLNFCCHSSFFIISYFIKIFLSFLLVSLASLSLLSIFSKNQFPFIIALYLCSLSLYFTYFCSDVYYFFSSTGFEIGLLFSFQDPERHH